MSVTVTIARNHDYCREHGLETTHQAECQCELKSCACCDGTGWFTWTERPWELNLATGNFRTLAAALGGFGEDCCGSADARRLLTALQTFNPELALRAPQQEVGVGGALRLYTCGVDRAQVARYVRELMRIVQEAERREEPVVWY